MVELNVKGMTCGHCVRAVTRAVRVEGQSSPDELIRALRAAGYPALPG